MDIGTGPLAEAARRRLTAFHSQRANERLFAHDATLWKVDAAHQKVIRHRLGWLDIAHKMSAHMGELAQFARELAQQGFRHAVLLGMGGSSLCPEVLRQMFPPAPSMLDLQVLDSTAPESVAAMEAAVDLHKTLFIVSTKSGTTTETLSFHQYFHAKMAALKEPHLAGSHFCAITDGGTPLEALAKTLQFRKIFINPSDIGGRYSALSYFGLVPAALLGLDLDRLLASAHALVRASAPTATTADNDPLLLGALLGEAGLAGRNKITFALSPALAPFGLWVEQLIAESTGKEGKGLIPVEGESLGPPAAYGADRLFVSMRLAPETEDPALGPLEQANHPVARLVLADTYALGGEFWRWEVATTLASALLQVNPFDEPNVTEAKERTAEALQQFEQEGHLPVEPPTATEGVLRAFVGARLRLGTTPDLPLRDLLSLHLGTTEPGDYIALLAYLHETPQRDALLRGLRLLLRDRTQRATTLGYGPRFLHSTGQLHKGGPDSGVFLQITTSAKQELPIPGARYGFATLIAAQALGDLRSLDRRGRRVLRMDVGADVDAGLDQLGKALRAAL